jgi:chromosome segregation ATPase
MAQGSSDSSNPSVPVGTLGPLPTVRLELGHGSTRVTRYDVPEAGFLIGTVPGCDVRLPGTNLPPVVALITRHRHGVVIRKLAPLFAVLVNGQPVSGALLSHGDRLTVGPVELLVHIAALDAAEAGPPPPAAEPSGPPELEERVRDLDERQRRLEEQARELEADRVLWYRRRDDLEQECRQLERGTRTDAAAATATERAALAQERQEVELRATQLAQQQEQLAEVRRELTTLRQQLYDRYQERRDRVAGLQAAVRRAIRKLQARKRQFDEEVRKAVAVQQADQTRQREQELDARAEALSVQTQALEERARLFESRREQLQTELGRRVLECQEREQRLQEEEQSLNKARGRYQEDVLRLDRLQAALEQRQRQLQARALEVDRRSEQLQRSTRELEEQAAELDAWQAHLSAEAEDLKQARVAQDTAGAELTQRAATLEGQQTMLATLRTRLERKREEALQEEKQLADQRARQQAEESELRERTQQAARLRLELENDKELHEKERQRFEERRALLESAVAQLRQAQESLAIEQKQVEERGAELDATTIRQAEEGGLLRGRADQLDQLQQRLEADRQHLSKRETELATAELALENLQEQLRRRSEELNALQRAHQEQSRLQAEETAALETRRAELELERLQAEELLNAQRQELALRTAKLDGWTRELDEREVTLRQHVDRLNEIRTGLERERETFQGERTDWETTQRTASEALAQARVAFESARDEAQGLRTQLPELELRAQAALDRLAQAREQLREHLAEVHAYAQQSRDDLAALRTQVQAEAARVLQEEAGLHRARDEHRLAVVGYRQQLIDWQGQVAEIQRALAQGESRLERRQAEVEEQARRADATTARLAQEAEHLQQQQRQVAVKHGEMQRHLDDMREWYRRKLRELAASQGGGVGSEAESANPTAGSASGPSTTEPAILALTGEIEPGDRQLGDLLRSLELVDADTLTTLLSEARRQRRSLRQLLLSGSYLTLYQMALIEAGNVDALVLGPVRVVDRVRATPHEVVYRVFDPRRGQEAILRHLGEADAVDAVRPDEFRQRFVAAAAVQHPHLAATLEVLEVAGRPAVLQEWLSGQPSTEWSQLAAVPGVWFRLVCQAALGLHTAHQAGLVHGHLDADLIVLTGEGVLKVCGFGEPAWLLGSATGAEESDAAADLAALGRMASAWAQPAGEGGRSPRKNARTRSLPETLQEVVQRLTTEDAGQRYPSAGALLEDLDRAGAELPANAAAWERLLAQVRDQATPVGLRLSA